MRKGEAGCCTWGYVGCGKLAAAPRAAAAAVAASGGTSAPGSPAGLLTTGRPARRGQLPSRVARLQARSGGAVKRRAYGPAAAFHPSVAAYLIGVAIAAGARGALAAALCCCIAPKSPGRDLSLSLSRTPVGCVGTVVTAAIRSKGLPSWLLAAQEEPAVLHVPPNCWAANDERPGAHGQDIRVLPSHSWRPQGAFRHRRPDSICTALGAPDFTSSLQDQHVRGTATQLIQRGRGIAHSSTHNWPPCCRAALTSRLEAWWTAAPPAASQQRAGASCPC